jgi:hypothetical protein
VFAGLSSTLIFVALGAALWSLVLMIVNVPVLPRRWFGLGLLGVLALLELGLLGQAVLGFVRMFTADRELDELTYGGYLVGSLAVLPLAALWALAERSRWGPGVLLVGCLTVPVLIVRLGQIWEAHV